MPKFKLKEIKRQLIEIHGLSRKQVDYLSYYLWNEQMVALNDLYDSGLRGRHLLQWEQPQSSPLPPFFDSEHISCLKFLINRRRLSCATAVQEISKLCVVRAAALERLYDWGLRGKHLRQWRRRRSSPLPIEDRPLHSIDESFSIVHKECLETLIETHKLNCETAVEEISDLPIDQADALERLYGSGLRGKHLRRWQSSKFCESLTSFHVRCLSVLIGTHNLEGETAVEEISNLSVDKADALAELYGLGLRGQHLRQWQPSEFEEEKGQCPIGGHKECLRALIETHNLNCKAAIKEISQLSHREAVTLKELFKSGLRGEHLRQSRPFHFRPDLTEQIDYCLKTLVETNDLDGQTALQEISGLNSEQLKTLSELYHLGLCGKHLRQWQQDSELMYDLEHRNCLKKLIRTYSLDAEHAVQQIKKLSSREAFRVDFLLLDMSDTKLLVINNTYAHYLRAWQLVHECDVISHQRFIGFEQNEDSPAAGVITPEQMTQITDDDLLKTINSNIVMDRNSLTNWLDESVNRSLPFFTRQTYELFQDQRRANHPTNDTPLRIADKITRHDINLSFLRIMLREGCSPDNPKTLPELPNELNIPILSYSLYLQQQSIAQAMREFNNTFGSPLTSLFSDNKLYRTQQIDQFRQSSIHDILDHYINVIQLFYQHQGTNQVKSLKDNYLKPVQSDDLNQAITDVNGKESRTTIKQTMSDSLGISYSHNPSLALHYFMVGKTSTSYEQENNYQQNQQVAMQM